MLVKKYNEDDTTISSYIENKSVNEIAKLLTKCHGNYVKFCLKDTTFFTHAFKVMFNSYLIANTSKYIKGYMNVKYCVMHVHPLKQHKSVMKDVKLNHLHV